MASTAARNNLTQVSPRTAVAGTPRTRRPTCQGHTAARATSPRSRTTHKYQAAGPARSAPPRRRSRAATRLCAAAAPRPVWKSNLRRVCPESPRHPPRHRRDPARRRGDVGSSPLDRASAATSSPSAPDTLVDFHTGRRAAGLDGGHRPGRRAHEGQGRGGRHRDDGRGQEGGRGTGAVVSRPCRARSRGRAHTKKPPFYKYTVVYDGSVARATRREGVTRAGRLPPSARRDGA